MLESVGPNLVQAFEDQCYTAAREGRTGALLNVWVRGFLNLLWTVLAERWLIASAYLRGNGTGGGLGMGTIVQDLKLAAFLRYRV